MKVISPANETVMQMLKNFTKPGEKYRMLKYTVHTEIEDGILLFNLFTRELLLLTKDEFENAIDNAYLRENWFVVPEKCDEKAYVDLIKFMLKSKIKPLQKITGYTIFTTTDCNARCFYCFEMGRSRIPMSHETALQVVSYIKKHCDGSPVRISWFGGEPLLNQDAINTISAGLKQEGIKFTSNMLTNAYLFDKEVIADAVEKWNLKHIQITLDGTENVYNKIKAYIHKDCNPYQIVLRNIQELLNFPVTVAIRLNMDTYNAEDLLNLVDDLALHFKGKDNVFIYAHHLFNMDEPDATLHSEQEWQERKDLMARLNQRIADYGLSPKGGINKRLAVTHCMSDSGQSITILPTGKIGLCERYVDSEYIGHINEESFDQTMIASWRETVPEIPECNSCFYYPECNLIKKCGNQSVCFSNYREESLDFTILKMKNEYSHWLHGKNAKQDADQEGELYDQFS